MKYLTNLKWYEKLAKFDEPHKKVLLALSQRKHSWRTRERIAKTTGMSESQVDKVLEDLISKKKVVASLSKKKNVIYGLRERTEN